MRCLKKSNKHTSSKNHVSYVIVFTHDFIVLSQLYVPKPTLGYLPFVPGPPTTPLFCFFTR